MERWRNKIAVVTGANKGIGAAIAKDLLAAGLKVVGLDKDIDCNEDVITNLPQHQQSQFWAIKCDVTQIDSVNKAFDEIIFSWGGVDILVNNAGTICQGQLVSLDPLAIKKVLETNVLGMVNSTQRAFKSMKERNAEGHVVLINSDWGHKVVTWPPGQLIATNIYSPSKYAITAMTEIYRQEFWGMGTKVKVTSISPGTVNTELADKSHQQYMLDPHDVANAILFALSTPPHVQIHELTIKPIGECF